MKEHYRELLNYIQKIENKYGTVGLMNNRERNYMLKLSYPCYKNEYADLNKYEITIIKRYLNGDINVRQLSYYLGGIASKKAERKAQLYKAGRYELTNHRNYWEVKNGRINK